MVFQLPCVQALLRWQDFVFERKGGCFCSMVTRKCRTYSSVSMFIDCCERYKGEIHWLKNCPIDNETFFSPCFDQLVWQWLKERRGGGQDEGRLSSLWNEVVNSQSAFDEARLCMLLTLMIEKQIWKCPDYSDSTSWDHSFNCCKGPLLKSSLNQLSAINRIVLRCIPASCGIAGNEIAYRIAKEGTKKNNTGTECYKRKWK